MLSVAFPRRVWDSAPCPDRCRAFRQRARAFDECIAHCIMQADIQITGRPHGLPVNERLAYILDVSLCAGSCSELIGVDRRMIVSFCIVISA